jgi:hypothetical protein
MLPTAVQRPAFLLKALDPFLLSSGMRRDHRIPRALACAIGRSVEATIKANRWPQPF